MERSRREILTYGLGGVAATLSMPALAAVCGKSRGRTVPLAYFQWQLLVRGGVRPLPGTVGSPRGALVLTGDGGNSLVICGEKQSLIVDTKNAPFGSVLARDALALGASGHGSHKMVVVNTHHHADHTGGNPAFTAGCLVIAHQNAVDRVKSQIERYKSGTESGMADLLKRKETDPKVSLALSVLERDGADLSKVTAEQFVPNNPISGDATSLDAGGETIVLLHYGPGHTDNDLVVHVRSDNILHAGDLLFHKTHPFLDRAGGGDSAKWITALGKVIGLCDKDTIVVPGHGEVTDIEGLKGQVRYFERAREAIKAAIDQGVSRDEVAKTELEEFKAYDKPQLRPMTFGAIYDELTGMPVEKLAAPGK
ncbi:MAG: MBL fold metallo-hydrolase [Phycisphaerales bacterium]|nr:MBL fold metallo-hydrolase [Phycisphaerales bacterium]